MTLELKDCRLCDERRFTTRVVAGCGNKDSWIALLGRNPGRLEDIKGLPFIGPAGKKLDEGLAIAGLDRKELYVTNVSKCYTPIGVVPSPLCRKTCTTKWLVPELATMSNLRLVIAFGNEAMQVFEPRARVGELHGNCFCVPRPWTKVADLWLFVSYHPSAALRSTSINALFLEDMEKLKVVVHQYQMLS